MPIPDLTAEGILPPFVGPGGPGAGFQDMSPYPATALEVINRFGTTPNRKSILRRWLAHRKALRGVGFDRGFQWLDGSFVENREPNDLDVVTYLYRPKGLHDPQSFNSHVNHNSHLFDHANVRSSYGLDLFAVDLDGPPERIVEMSRYFMNLFSHRRNDHLWKGMLTVRLEDTNDDRDALAALGSTSTS